MNTHRCTVLVSALLVAGALAACGDRNQTAGQKVDQTVASAERKAAEIKEDIKQGAAEVKRDVKQGAAEVKDAAAQAATGTRQLASDASITATVNVELAKDSSLSALKIDVDTSNGRVALIGTAPNAQAKAHATELAAKVAGVVSVDNRLTLQ